jgi:hypothetical protein
MQKHGASVLPIHDSLKGGAAGNYGRLPPISDRTGTRFEISSHSRLSRFFPVVTSSISRPDLPAQSFGGAHRGRVCVCAFIGVSVCACI